MNYKLAIIGILLAGFSFIGYSVYVAVSLRDAEVVDNAYEAGLRYDQTVKEATRLGWRVELPRTLSVSPGRAADLKIRVTDKEGNGVSGATVDMKINRMGNRQTQTCRCLGGNDGRYIASVAADKPGYWEARVVVARGGESFAFDNNVNIVFENEQSSRR